VTLLPDLTIEATVARRSAPTKCDMRTTPIKTAELVSGRYKIRRPIKDA
jgi:hypothetical protein